MKRSILLIAGWLTIISISGQNYFPVVEENNEWNVVQFGQTGPYPWDSVCWTESYKISGDTSISNIAYKKIFKSEEEFPANWGYEGAIREEDEKVWYINQNGNEETLLYDFALGIGDTIMFLYEPLIVDTIFYAEINGQQRKHLRFLYFGEIWIEGIGSTRGILQSGTSGFVGGGSWLLCKHENDEMVYMNPNFNSCYLITTGLDEINDPEIEIYPNPAKDKMMIKISDPVKINTITITDVLGHTIKEVEYHTPELDLSGLSSGIYLLRFKLENREVIRKIIIE